VEFDNDASNRFTVVEISARDRPALLNRLARALFEARLIVHSAHIATYGERAIDTFYVTDLFAGKIDTASRLKSVEKRLLEAASEDVPEVAWEDAGVTPRAPITVYLVTSPIGQARIHRAAGRNENWRYGAGLMACGAAN
jgi:glycine cleavage system regulatory protein